MELSDETLLALEKAKEELIRTYGAYLVEAVQLDIPEEEVELVRMEAAEVLKKVDRAILQQKYIIAMRS